jgi:hypothetical protein
VTDDKWQPFETAPKFGVFLVWLEKPRLDSHVWPMKRSGKFVTIGEQFAFDCDENVLFWRPMPAPPLTVC